MPFKINISHKGKTFQIETESEVIVGKKIGEKIKGGDIASNLEGYELEITGTSDISGIPGFKGLEGIEYHRKLLKYGPGMKDKRKGIRLRKTLRGEEISLKTIQVNTNVIKEGKKKFKDLTSKPEEEKPVEEKKEEKPTEEKKEETKEPKEEVREEKPVEEKKEETKEEETKQEKPAEEKTDK